jgi:hypothetical protein
MSTRLRAYIRQHHLALLCLFLIVTGGTASATHPGGADTISSVDIIDNEVKGDDINNGAVTSADINNSNGVFSEDVRDDTAPGGGLAATDLQAGSVGTSELSSSAFLSGDIARAGGGAFEITADAIQSSEVSGSTLTGSDVAADSLTGSDVSESTLVALDAHDGGYPTCDPHDSEFIDCGELSFTLGRPMSVSAFWTYGFGTDGGDPPIGTCRTVIDGSPKTTFNLHSEDDSDFNLGGIPVSDVLALGAGAHTIGFQCEEDAPNSSDIVIEQLRMMVIELAFD